MMTNNRPMGFWSGPPLSWVFMFFFMLIFLSPWCLEIYFAFPFRPIHSLESSGLEALFMNSLVLTFNDTSVKISMQSITFELFSTNTKAIRIYT